MTVQVSNNASGTLSAGIAIDATALTLSTGNGALFPAVSVASGEWFYATIFNAVKVYEIVKVTEHVFGSDVFDVIVRAQDNTTAHAFLRLDTVELRPVAAVINNLKDDTAVALAAAAHAEASAINLSAAAEATAEAAGAAAIVAGSGATLSANIHAATNKAVPVDADEIGLADSEASFSLKKLTIANLKALVFGAWGVLTAAGTSKTAPVDADVLAIGDSEATNATKKLTVANLRAAFKVTFDALYGGFSAGTSPDSFAMENDSFITTSYTIGSKSFVNCTAAISDLISVVAHGLVAGSMVQFKAGTLPSPLTADTVYYVIASGLTADVFKVSTTDGGSAVDITTTGTAVQVGKVRNAISAGPITIGSSATVTVPAGSVWTIV